MTVKGLVAHLLHGGDGFFLIIERKTQVLKTRAALKQRWRSNKQEDKVLSEPSLASNLPLPIRLRLHY